MCVVGASKGDMYRNCVCRESGCVYVNEYWSALMVRWGKNSERKRNMSVERTYEKWKMRARMLEASLKSPRVSISALESGKELE